MTIEQEIFQKYRPDWTKLKDYGFCSRGEEPALSKEIAVLSGMFRGEIRVSPAGEVSGRLYDREDGEEYLPLHVSSQGGSFVTEVREAYRAVLREIREACFYPVAFREDQANRIAAWVYETYGDRPEYPFDEAEVGAVFRHKETEKWYGLVMPVGKSKVKTEAERLREQAEKEREKQERALLKQQGKKLPRKKKAEPAEDPIIEILNVKLPAEEVQDLLQKKGYYPAYHMTKKSWLTVILDDSLPDEEIRRLLACSYSQVSKGKAGEKQGIHTWLIPANPKYYDIVRGFQEHEVLDWKQSSEVHVGDILYMYVGAPNGAIMYRCRAEQVDIPYTPKNETERELSVKRVMMLRRLETYPDTLLPRKRMQELGVYGVRGPRSMPANLIEEIERRKEEIGLTF